MFSSLIDCNKSVVFLCVCFRQPIFLKAVNYIMFLFPAGSSKEQAIKNVERPKSGLVSSLSRSSKRHSKTNPLETGAEVRAGSSVFYVKDEDNPQGSKSQEAETGLLIDFSEIETAKADADSATTDNLVSLLDTSLPSIPKAMGAPQASLPSPLVPPVGTRYDQVPDEEEFFVQTSNVSTSTSNVTSSSVPVSSSLGNPFTTTSIANQQMQPSWMQGQTGNVGQSQETKKVHNVRTNPFERTNAMPAPKYDPVAADMVTTTNNMRDTQLPRYDDVPVETGQNWTVPSTQANQWVRFYDEVPKEEQSNNKTNSKPAPRYDDVPKDDVAANNTRPSPIQAALQAGKPAAACAPISVTKMTPIQPQPMYSPVPNDQHQRVADSFDPLKASASNKPAYSGVKTFTSAAAKSGKPQNNVSSVRPTVSAQSHGTTSSTSTTSSGTVSVADRAKMLNSKLKFNPMTYHVSAEMYTDATRFAPVNHDDFISSDKAPLISSLRRSSETDIKIPSKDIDFEKPKDVQATFVGSKKFKDDEHLLLMSYPKKDRKAGNLIDFSPEGTPGNSYVLDPTTPDLPPRIPLLQQPPAGRSSGRRTIPREERRSDPLAQRTRSHVFQKSETNKENSQSCPIDFGREDSTAPPIPPRDPITDTRPSYHRQMSHPRTKDEYNSKKSYILPIMRDGEKISNTHYFLLPPKPAHMSDENETFVNVPLQGKNPRSAPATAHIKPIMRDGNSDTHYLVTPPPLTAGSVDFFAESFKANNLTGGGYNTDHHNFTGHKSHVNHLHRSPVKDKKSNHAFDLSSLKPILPEDNLGSSSSSKFSHVAHFHKPTHNHHSGSSHNSPRHTNSYRSSTEDPDLLQSETPATASEKVRRVMAQVHGVTNDESRGALIGNAWDVERAVHELKTEALFQLGGVSREQCEDLLKTMNWDLELASTVMLEQNTHQ